jgi:hypothetical protein
LVVLFAASAIVMGSTPADKPAYDDPHMHRRTFTFKDQEHFSQEWVLLANGKENPVASNFERAK